MASGLVVRCHGAGSKLYELEVDRGKAVKVWAAMQVTSKVGGGASTRSYTRQW